MQPTLEFLLRQEGKPVPTHILSLQASIAGFDVGKEIEINGKNYKIIVVNPIIVKSRIEFDVTFQIHLEKLD